MNAVFQKRQGYHTHGLTAAAASACTRSSQPHHSMDWEKDLQAPPLTEKWLPVDHFWDRENFPSLGICSNGCPHTVHIWKTLTRPSRVFQVVKHEVGWVTCSEEYVGIWGKNWSGYEPSLLYACMKLSKIEKIQRGMKMVSHISNQEAETEGCLLGLDWQV